MRPTLVPVCKMPNQCVNGTGLFRCRSTNRPVTPALCSREVMSRDIYTTYIGAKAVSLAWIGAAFGPIFLAIGLDGGFNAHFYIGVVSLATVFLAVLDGIKGLRHGVLSDFWACAVVPIVLLVMGVGLAWCAYRGYI